MVTSDAVRSSLVSMGVLGGAGEKVPRRTAFPMVVASVAGAAFVISEAIMVERAAAGRVMPLDFSFWWRRSSPF